MVECVRSTVMFHRRIEMRAGRSRIRCRAIAFFVNMKTVFARCQILNVGRHLHVVANFRKRDRPGDFAPGLRLELTDRLGNFLCLRETSNRAECR